MAQRPTLDADSLAVLDNALAALGTCGYTFVTGKPCPEHGAPTRPVATVTVLQDPDDEDRLTIEARANGISRAAVAYTLRHAAAEFDAQALAEGDEPIPYPAEQPTPEAATLTAKQRQAIREEAFAYAATIAEAVAAEMREADGAWPEEWSSREVRDAVESAAGRIREYGKAQAQQS
ncbi:hypothetical protein ACH4JZ_18450 [Streptomyces sp. NPDC017615]|uniref:hypothetical protein n=1 Tax=Streptomyces sp. NPDC017615 TaxID=3365003 RepID=UPI0037929CD2